MNLDSMFVIPELLKDWIWRSLMPFEHRRRNEANKCTNSEEVLLKTCPSIGQLYDSTNDPTFIGSTPRNKLNPE